MAGYANDTLYLGVDVRHPSMTRCATYETCLDSWHSPRNCPNAAVFNMSPANVTSDDSPPLAVLTTGMSRGTTVTGVSGPAGSTLAPVEAERRGGGNDLSKVYSTAAISGNYSVDGAQTSCSVRVQEQNCELLVHVKEALMERINDCGFAHYGL